jgi:hypothetical protein
MATVLSHREQCQVRSPEPVRAQRHARLPPARGQVRQQRRQLAQGASLVGAVRSARVLLDGEPAGGEVLRQRVGSPLAVRVGRAVVGARCGHLDHPPTIGRGRRHGNRSSDAHDARHLT